STPFVFVGLYDERVRLGTYKLGASRIEISEVLLCSLDLGMLYEGWAHGDRFTGTAGVRDRRGSGCTCVVTWLLSLFRSTEVGGSASGEHRTQPRSMPRLASLRLRRGGSPEARPMPQPP